MIEWSHCNVFYSNIYFKLFYVWYSFSKASMPGTICLELATIYICIFAIVKYRSNIGGVSDGVARMISVLLKFIFVSVCVEIFNTCPKGHYHIHKRGSNMCPLVICIGHINDWFVSAICTVWHWCLLFCVLVLVTMVTI